MSHSLLLVAGLSLIYYIASMAIGMGLGKLFHMEEHRARIFVLLQSFANVGFLGIRWRKNCLVPRERWWQWCIIWPLT